MSNFYFRMGSLTNFCRLNLPFGVNYVERSKFTLLTSANHIPTYTVFFKFCNFLKVNIKNYFDFKKFFSLLVDVL